MRKYQIIYADPPWNFDHKASGANGDLEQYPRMSIQDIKELSVAQISDKDCALILWSTWAHLKDALEVGEAWGFRYVTTLFVWHKQQNRLGLGHYTRMDSEPCLLFRKGSVKKWRKRANIVQTWKLPNVRHSQKPQEFRELIEELFGERTRIELFARQTSSDWDVWGNEVESDIKL